MSILASLAKLWGPRTRPSVPLLDISSKFQENLRGNQRATEIITYLGEKDGGELIFDLQYLWSSVREAGEEINVFGV